MQKNGRVGFGWTISLVSVHHCVIEMFFAAKRIHDSCTLQMSVSYITGITLLAQSNQGQRLVLKHPSSFTKLDVARAPPLPCDGTSDSPSQNARLGKPEAFPRETEKKRKEKERKEKVTANGHGWFDG